MQYTDEFLISELQRFYSENDRIPTSLEMNKKNGYPSYVTYFNHFKTWNKALEIANLPLNQYQNCWQDGTETCSYCHKRADEIFNFTNWYYNNGIRYCKKHGERGLRDYVTGNLDINSKVGLGRAGEILVAKTLGIGKEHDCNRISCHSSTDMYNDKYGKIDVKTRLFNLNQDRWNFKLNKKDKCDTYICVGLSSNRKHVVHVLIIPNIIKHNNLKSIGISNSLDSLIKRRHLEVDAKPYNDVWQTMKLNSCKIMVDKNKVIV